MTKPLASLSLDLDNKWSYLKTHGDGGWESRPSYLERVVPRVLDVLDRLGLRITFFVVGQDAARECNESALRQIVAAGHEIGNHSFEHEPWLHLYSPARLEEELTAAESAIEAATGARPRGFRGPGYSLSPEVLASLARRGYQYDASTLPTFIGPLARTYYFFTARLNRDERMQRRRLFGGWQQVFQSIRPYCWQFDKFSEISAMRAAPLLEIPISTMPLLRAPIHFSYLLFLRRYSIAAARSYWWLAMRLCRAFGIEPSLLLHPLDFVGGDEEGDLDFFPAMDMASSVKRRFVSDLLSDFADRFEVLPLTEYAARLTERPSLAVRRVRATAGDKFVPLGAPQPALTMEATRQ